jgi:hypothetical protein
MVTNCGGSREVGNCFLNDIYMKSVLQSDSYNKLLHNI